MLRISRNLIDEIEAHMEEAYPYECCGLIIGTTGETKRAEASRRCGNLITERAADRYELDPKDMLKVQRELDGGPWDIIGAYHSHPDHPSRPSGFDTDHAWKGYSYIIGSVEEGKIGNLQSWELDETGEAFDEEEIEVVAQSD